MPSHPVEDGPVERPAPPIASPLDLMDPEAVAETLRTGARACREAACRQGSIDLITASSERPGRLVATGDLHDNPLHLARLAEIVELPLALAGAPAGEDASHASRDLCSAHSGCHITFHELIHSDRLVGGMDFSYRVLTRVAALKAFAPERVHVLLANHELAQISGAGVVKNGVRCVEAFNDAVDEAFGEDAQLVHDAIADFIRAMPLALRCQTPKGDILCAHSLPGPAMMGRFDMGILERELTEADYVPREGSAHMMVWGRKYDAEQLEDLVERWGVNLFVLGHEHAPHGIAAVEPCAIVLNSDHARGVYLPIDLADPPEIASLLGRARPLAV